MGPTPKRAGFQGDRCQLAGFQRAALVGDAVAEGGVDGVPGDPAPGAKGDCPSATVGWGAGILRARRPLRLRRGLSEFADQALTLHPLSILGGHARRHGSALAFAGQFAQRFGAHRVGVANTAGVVGAAGAVAQGAGMARFGLDLWPPDVCRRFVGAVRWAGVRCPNGTAGSQPQEHPLQP